jgi:hypothetical protein
MIISQIGINSPSQQPPALADWRAAVDLAGDSVANNRVSGNGPPSEVDWQIHKLRENLIAAADSYSKAVRAVADRVPFEALIAETDNELKKAGHRFENLKKLVTAPSARKALDKAWSDFKSLLKTFAESKAAMRSRRSIYLRILADQFRDLCDKIHSDLTAVQKILNNR